MSHVFQTILYCCILPSGALYYFMVYSVPHNVYNPWMIWCHVLSWIHLVSCYIIHHQSAGCGGEVNQYHTLLFTYPYLQFPHIKYLHRCRLSHCEHFPGTCWQILRWVFATTRVSACISLAGDDNAYFPSSDNIFRRTELSTVK